MQTPVDNPPGRLRARSALLVAGLVAIALFALTACGGEDGALDQIRGGTDPAAGEVENGAPGAADPSDDSPADDGGSGGGSGEGGGGSGGGGSSGGDSGDGGGSSGTGDGDGDGQPSDGTSEDDGVAAWVWALVAIGGVVILLLVFLIGRGSRRAPAGSASRSAQERQQILTSALSGWTAHGWAIEYETTDMATLRRDADRRQINVDEYGRVSQAQLPPVAGGGPPGRGTSASPPAA